MDRPSAPVEHDDPLGRIVASSRSTGRAYVVLALGLVSDSDDMVAATEVALAIVEAELGVDMAAAQVVQRDGREALGLICAEVAPALDPAELGTAAAAHLRTTDAISVGVASSAGHPDLTLEHAIAVALEGLDVARAAGSTRAVHSELYDLATASTGIERPTESDAIGSDAPPRADATTDRAPTSVADDPFAQFIESDVALPLAPDHTSPATPARERAALTAEIMSLQVEAASLREHDKHAHALLERRISKLAHELESAESEIDRLRTTYEGDRGLPSVYRQVQGLDESESLAPLKKDLIDGLFRENERE